MTDTATRRWTVGLTAIGSVMAALDTLVVAAALSTIRIDLGATVEELEWTVNAYNLSFAVLMITAAALGDRLGRRRMYAAGLTLFALASAACALAPSVRPLMVTGLALQAIGLVWLALVVDAGATYSELLAPFVVAGIGISMAIPSGQNSVVGSIEVADLGKAAGANSMMRELGGVFGIAVVVAVFAAVGGYASPAEFSDGFAAAVIVAAGLAALGALVSLAVPGRRATPDRLPAEAAVEGSG